ncbi:toll-like receptor hypothetical protein [Limosa lapponica baueri]|uniref:Toll-like receptor 4 n=1 Tax=Limosa lapponica baueri TaxID=1758121 RepID=A0A2I0TJ33_LIMLA|nr:toll-like receptor hypothetical protein [Limosa lapponica baueri]
MPRRGPLPPWTLVVLLQLVLVSSQVAGCLLSPCLEYLGTAAFYGLTSLKKLVLVETNITSLSDLPIGHLHTLQELNLGHNSIASLKLPKYFTNLTSLRHLSFLSNKITYISKGDLGVLGDVNRLNLTLVLSLNDIKCIEPGSFAGIHLGELVLRSSFANYSVMQKSLQGLTGLQVNRLIVGEFSNSQRLEDFQSGLLSGLCQVQMQEFVLICFRDFERDTDTLFNCIGNVSSIRLVNLELKEVSEVPMFSQVKQLECKTCKFKEVPAVKLSLFKELRVLRITKSKHLNSFRQKFESLSNLEVIDLSENRLSFTGCCSPQFRECPNLKHLNLSFNSDISVTGDFTNCHARITVKVVATFSKD